MWPPGFKSRKQLATPIKIGAQLSRCSPWFHSSSCSLRSLRLCGWDELSFSPSRLIELDVLDEVGSFDEVDDFVAGVLVAYGLHLGDGQAVGVGADVPVEDVAGHDRVFAAGHPAA